MSLAETYHAENIHARWSQARRYMVMTRAVSLILLVTSGLVMHTTLMKTGNAAIGQFDQISAQQDR